jgi:hypothetical protein
MGMPSYFLFAYPSKCITFSKKQLRKKILDYNVYLAGLNDGHYEDIYTLEDIGKFINEAKIYGYYSIDYKCQIYEMMYFLKLFHPLVPSIQLHFRYIEDMFYYLEAYDDPETGEIKVQSVNGFETDPRFYRENEKQETSESTDKKKEKKKKPRHLYEEFIMENDFNLEKLKENKFVNSITDMRMNSMNEYHYFGLREKYPTDNQKRLDSFFFSTDYFSKMLMYVLLL